MTARIHVAGILLLLTGCTTADSGPAPVNDRPAMFRENPAHTGVARTEPVDHFGAIAWSFQADGAVIGSPVVSGNVLYIAGGKGILYALDRESGQETWSYDTGHPVGSTPAVAAGRVFITTRSGTIHALDAGSGRHLWEFESGPTIDFPWGHESGDIYVSSPVPDGEDVLFGSGDGSIYCLNAATGSLVWQAATEGRVRSTPAIADGRVIAGSADGHIYAFDRSTGDELWRYETHGTSLNSGEFGFDRRTVQSSPAVAHSLVFVGAKDGYLYALDAASGREVWTFDHDVSWINTSPAVSDSLVVAATSDGRDAHAFDVRTGEVVWRVETPGIVWASPTVAGDFVYVGTGAGVLLALDRRTGREIWRYVAGSQIFSTPVVDDGMLFVGLMDGRLVALTDRHPPLRRTVFHDQSLEERSTVGFGRDLSAYLERRGYTIAGLDALGSVLADPEHHVVVFAMDHLPASHAETFRRFLESGGKVVWVGLPPHILMPDDPDDVSLLDYDREATEALLGVSHDAANFDYTLAAPTPAGRRWGFSGSWRSGWSIRPEAADEVLALDDLGLAAAWLERYGGPPGTGFIRVQWAAGDRAPDSFFESIRMAAEYFPASGIE